jgi:hypothetical protein
MPNDRPFPKHGLSARERIEAARLRKTSGCDICGLVLELAGPRGTLPNIDHDHKTGKVRGVLCSRCNTGLSFLEKSKYIVNRALRYLVDPPGAFPDVSVLDTRRLRPLKWGRKRLTTVGELMKEEP